MKRGKWDNCNSIINKIYILKKDFTYLVLERKEETGRETSM